jgi:hypothetical protein
MSARLKLIVCENLRVQLTRCSTDRRSTACVASSTPGGTREKRSRRGRPPLVRAHRLCSGHSSWWCPPKSRRRREATRGGNHASNTRQTEFVIARTLFLSFQGHWPEPHFSAHKRDGAGYHRRRECVVVGRCSDCARQAVQRLERDVIKFHGQRQKRRT